MAIVFDRTWYHSWNNVPTSQATSLAQSQYMWFGIVSFLLARGWTCECSSDGVSASSPGGANYWVSAANLSWGAAAHSWIWLKSPADYPSTGNRMWLLIDFASANVYEATFSFCTAVPTGVFSVSSSGTKTNPNTFASKTFKRSTLGNAKWHVIGTAQGDFMAFISMDGTGYAAFCLGLVATNNRLEATEPYSALELAAYNDGAGGALVASILGSPVHVNGHWYDGTAGAQTLPAAPATYASTLMMSLYTSLGDRRPGALNGVFPDPPIQVYSTNPISYRGVLIDVRGAPNGGGVLQATVYPDNTAVESAIVGVWTVPANLKPLF